MIFLTNETGNEHEPIFMGDLNIEIDLLHAERYGHRSILPGLLFRTDWVPMLGFPPEKV